MTDLLPISFLLAFSNHFALSEFSRLGAFMRLPTKLYTPYGIAIATGSVLIPSVILFWMAQHWLLIPLGLGYLSIPTFIFLLAALMQSTKTILKKQNSLRFRAWSMYFLLVTINCAALGVALVTPHYSLIKLILYSVGASAGFGLVWTMYSAMCERLETADIPAPLRGEPIALLTAGLMSLALIGFINLSQ